ncbi:hypothetical protein [Dokdonella sp.]|uniref:hypothetical protein n=1 Tax=Dokdonella sp. TaxID=2291710 RepID=UPI0035295444
MIFLIEYDRASGSIASLKEFEDGEGELAAKERLELEISLMNNGVVREVVLLQAGSIKALRVTHNRYFKNVAELAEDGSNLMSKLKLDDQSRSSGKDFT